MSSTDADIKELYSLILSLETEDDCDWLFKDLCTNKELEQMAQRIKAAKLLIEGKTYNQVMDECFSQREAFLYLLTSKNQ